MTKPQPKSAFTLIELLLVIGIIGLLAAIAIPNLLEAQTRTKVSRVHSNLRIIASAIESYRVDNGSYPPMWDPVNVPWQYHDEDFFINLTTPVAFLSDVPLDPFRETQKITIFDTRWYDVWEADTYRTYHIINNLWPADVSGFKDGSEEWDPEGVANRVKWGVKSTGPDLHYNYYWRDQKKIALGMDPPQNYEWKNAQGELMYPEYLAYEPTNGTSSDGDIIRVGP